MIKYPLYVTLDTNIFDANKLDFSKESTLGLLVNYVEAGKIKIVLSNIVIKEVEKHVIKSSDSICSAFRELRKKALSIASEGLLEQVGIKPDALFLNKTEYQEKCLGVWNKFLESLKPERIFAGNLVVLKIESTSDGSNELVDIIDEDIEFIESVLRPIERIYAGVVYLKKEKDLGQKSVD